MKTIIAEENYEYDQNRNLIYYSYSDSSINSYCENYTKGKDRQTKFVTFTSRSVGGNFSNDVRSDSTNISGEVPIITDITPVTCATALDIKINGTNIIEDLPAEKELKIDVGSKSIVLSFPDDLKVIRYTNHIAVIHSDEEEFKVFCEVFTNSNGDSVIIDYKEKSVVCMSGNGEVVSEITTDKSKFLSMKEFTIFDNKYTCTEDSIYSDTDKYISAKLESKIQNMTYTTIVHKIPYYILADCSPVIPEKDKSIYAYEFFENEDGKGDLLVYSGIIMENNDYLKYLSLNDEKL